MAMTRAVTGRDLVFATKDEARDAFLKLAGVVREWNLTPPGSPEADALAHEFHRVLDAIPSKERAA